MLSYLLYRHVGNQTFPALITSGASTCTSSPHGGHLRLYVESNHDGEDIFEDESGIINNDDFGDTSDDAHPDETRNHVAEYRSEGGPSSIIDRTSTHQSAESDNMSHHSQSESSRSNQQSGTSSIIDRTSTHQSAESSNMFHHSHFDTSRSNRQRSAKSDDQLEIDVEMMPQIHVHQKTLGNITFVDSEDLLKKQHLITVKRHQKLVPIAASTST